MMENKEITIRYDEEYENIILSLLEMLEGTSLNFVETVGAIETAKQLFMHKNMEDEE